MAPAVERLLRTHGFTLVRQRKHKIWKRRDGRMLVTASTPSDRNVFQNQLTQLSRVLGVGRQELLRPSPPRHRVRPEKPQPQLQAVSDVVPEPIKPTWTKLELKKFHRMLKHEEQRKEKLERLRAAMEEVAFVVNDGVMNGPIRCTEEELLDTIGWLLRYRRNVQNPIFVSHTVAELEDGEKTFNFITVGPWLIDHYSGRVLNKGDELTLEVAVVERFLERLTGVEA